MRIALVVYPGVLNDECDAFRSVLSLLPDAEVIGVGERVGPCHGPGGTQQVQVEYGALTDPDVVIVPGGLGAERIAESPELRAWLVAVEPVARYIVASSTGSVVLASAGLLHGEPAAGHWLASDLLRRYGSEQSERRVLVTGNIVTCQGSLSAVDAAFSLVRTLEGPAAVERIRATLIAEGEPHLRAPRWWERFVAGRPRHRPPPSGDAPGGRVTPLSVLVELVPVDELDRRRHPRRRRG